MQTPLQQVPSPYGSGDNSGRLERPHTDLKSLMGMGVFVTLIVLLLIFGIEPYHESPVASTPSAASSLAPENAAQATGIAHATSVATPATAQQADPPNAAASGHSSPSPTAANPAATTVASPNPVPVGSAPASPATSGSPELKYSWDLDASYECEFIVEVTIGDEKPQIRGKVSYQPTNAEPRTSAREGPKGEGSGTAFVAAPGGILVTCAHVVRGAVDVQAHFGNKQFPAKVIAFDGRHDLAILKIETSEMPCLPICDSEQVQLGQEARVVGFPLSTVLGESIKITRGTIAGIVHRKDENLFQIDASVNPGNSGGPLVDTKGRVIGIANALLDGEGVDRVGFSIPSNQALALLKTQGSAVTPLASGADLDGPELVRRVSPSVALVKVKFGAGGVATTPPKVVRYSGNYSLPPINRSMGPMGPIGPMGFPGFASNGPRQEDGKLVIDALGQVESYEGKLSLPLVLGPIGKMGLEKLPDDARRSWDSTRTVTIVQREEGSHSGRFPPFARGPRGPRSFPRPGMPGWPDEPESKVSWLPAVERIHYEIVSDSSDGATTIRKQYELATLQAKGEPDSLEIKGSGTITWDKKLGMPKKSEFQATLVSAEKGSASNIPFKVTCEFERKLLGVNPPSATNSPYPVSPGAVPGK